MTVLDDIMGTLAHYERRVEKMRLALEKISNCGQSIEPDHWKFREMARKVAAEALNN